MIDESMVLAAIEAQRARRNAPLPLDAVDVAERAALRPRETPHVEMLVQTTSRPRVARIFVRHSGGWRSRYVYRLADVDSTIARLLGRCA